MVTYAKLPGMSTLALLPAALVMVLVLAGGLEAGSGAGRGSAATGPDLRVGSALTDDAQFGWARTILQISGRRAGPEMGSASLLGMSWPLVTLAAATLFLLGTGLHSGPRLPQPSPRGPPTV
ncbi:MAG: hypothetical protein WD178_09275 [Actinomycetota bacterium]